MESDSILRRGGSKVSGFQCHHTIMAARPGMMVSSNPIVEIGNKSSESRLVCHSVTDCSAPRDFHAKSTM